MDEDTFESLAAQSQVFYNMGNLDVAEQLAKAAWAAQQGNLAEVNTYKTAANALMQDVPSGPVRATQAFGNELVRNVLGAGDFVFDQARNLTNLATGKQDDGARSSMRDVLPSAEEIMMTERGARQASMAADAALFTAPMAKGFQWGGQAVMSFVKNPKALNLISSLTKPQYVRDTVLSTIGAGAAGYVENPWGQLAIEALTPMGIEAGVGAIKTWAKNSKLAAAEGTITGIQNMPEEIAAGYLINALNDAEIDFDEAMRLYDNLGPEGIPADLDIAFQNAYRNLQTEGVLGTSKVKFLNDRIVGRARDDRTGQSRRLREDFADMPEFGGDSATFITDYQLAMKAEIDEAYDTARASQNAMPGKLTTWLEGDTGYAAEAYEVGLKNAQARSKRSGADPTPFDIVNETKQAYDDLIEIQIRKGGLQSASAIIDEKNAFLDIADETFTGYKEARNIFSSVAGMKAAQRVGEQFFKESPVDLITFAKDASAAEMKAFRLGARDAIMNQVESQSAGATLPNNFLKKQVNRDRVKILFKNDPKGMARFIQSMEREIAFLQTRKAISQQSATADKLSDAARMRNNVANLLAIANDPTGLSQYKVISDLVGRFTEDKSSELYREGLAIASDILSTQRGPNAIAPDRVRRLLSGGKTRELMEPILMTVLAKKSLPKSIMDNVRRMSLIEMQQFFQAQVDAGQAQEDRLNDLYSKQEGDKKLAAESMQNVSQANALRNPAAYMGLQQ